jgi:hypothetical protein
MDIFYRIKPGSSGSSMCPPGHPRHQYELWGYESPRHRREISIGAIDNALDPNSGASDAIRARVQKIMDEATLVPSEAWIRQVYGYFRHMYASENLDRNLSHAINHNPAEIVVNATRKALADTYDSNDLSHSDENYRDGSERPLRAARRGYEVTATRDGSEVFVYTLADDGSRYGALHLLKDHAATLTDNGYADVRIEPVQNKGNLFVPERVRATVPVKVEPIDPERHLAVLCIREYFPDHEPRLDLIVDPGKGYGSWPCTKCGERVQYEAKFDKHAVVTIRMDGTGMTHWSYGTECVKGGDHSVD